MYTTTTLLLYGLRPYSIINLIVSAKAIINLIIAVATRVLLTIKSIVHHTFPLLVLCTTRQLFQCQIDH